MTYSNTPHSITGKTPSDFLMNRISLAQGKKLKEAREKEHGQRQKRYADKHRRAKERKGEVGD